MDSPLVVAVIASGVILVALGILVGLLVGRARNARASNIPIAQPVKPAHLAPAPLVQPQPRQTARNGPDTIISSGRGGGPVVACGDYLTNGRLRNTEAARIGKEGEDRVVAEIESALDNRWYAFRNVVLPDNSGDLDIVLVGPGTWALEVKTYSGNWRVHNGKWYKQTSNGYWAHNSFGPGAQVIENARRLNRFLKDNGIAKGSYVDKAVILAQNTSIDSLSAGTEIWMLAELPRKLAALNSRPPMQQAQIERIASLLMAHARASTPALTH